MVLALVLFLLLREIKVDSVEILGDLMLVVKQLTGEYDCNDDIFIGLS